MMSILQMGELRIQQDVEAELGKLILRHIEVNQAIQVPQTVDTEGGGFNQNSTYRITTFLRTK